MNNRLFGKKHFKISELGLGCWQLGSDWGSVDIGTAKNILKTSIDNGITFFDTADVYGSGKSENIIGEYLNGQTDGITIATKIGRTAGLYPNKYTKELVARAVEASLKRLKVDAIDLLQLHCIPHKIMAKGEIFEWLRDLKKQGKIKEFGASIETSAEAELLLNDVPDIYSLQIIFNLFRQKPIYDIFPLAKAKQVGIIARVPLASGLLTGKLKHDSKFAEDDHRNYNRDGKFFNIGETFAGLPFHYGVEMANEMAKLLPQGMNLAQMALRWILDHETVSVVIPGASNTQQVVGNSSVSQIPKLPIELHKYLTKLYNDLVHKYIRGPY